MQMTAQKVFHAATWADRLNYQNSQGKQGRNIRILPVTCKALVTVADQPTITSKEAINNYIMLLIEQLGSAQLPLLLAKRLYNYTQFHFRGIHHAHDVMSECLVTVNGTIEVCEIGTDESKLQHPVFT